MINEAQYVEMLTLAQSMTTDYIDLSSDSVFTHDSLISLRNQLSVRKLKTHSKRFEYLMPDFVKRVHSGESLLSISRQINFSSYKLVKWYLDIQFQSKVSISSFLEQPSLVTDSRIRNDLLMCIRCDPTCSLESSLIAECCGREYEELLIEKLNELHLCFETEQELRSKGRSKTPDALLSIPMAVYTPYGGVDPLSVSWVDSKAIFADEVTFQENLPQLRAYLHRYGHGLVIYWFGFTAGVLEAARAEGLGLTVTDSFPEHWIYPTGELAVPERLPSFCRNLSGTEL